MHSSPPSLSRSIAIGAFGFGLVSLLVFATVAFAERWMYINLGVGGAYVAWTILFIVLGGGVLGWIVVGPWKLPKFYLLFTLAFFAYAAAWVIAYFASPGAIGEWIGALAGSLAMASIFAIGFRNAKAALKLGVLLFVTNAIGYFLGSALNNYFGGRAGMLLWGAAYGVFFGLGISAVLYFAQQRNKT